MQEIERDTGETPLALLKRPFPDQWSLSYWNMYNQLSGSRNWTMGGPTEIIYSEKIKWLDENEVVGRNERDDHLYVLSQLDNAYLEYCAKRAEKK